MKTIIKLTLVCMFLSLSTLFSQNSNNLVVFSESGDRFYLILNGMKYNQNPETNVKVTGLNATHYKAKIIFEKPAADVDGTVHLMWEGVAVTNKEFSYEVVRKGEHHKLKFISQADISGNVNTASVVYNADGTSGIVTTSNAGNGTVSTSVNGGGYNSNTTVTTTTTAASGPQGGNLGINMNVDGMNMSVNVNGAAPSNTLNTSGTTTVTTTTTSYSSSTSSYGNTVLQNNSTTNTTQNTNANAACGNAMSDDSFTELVNNINAKSFEDARLKVAKQAISSNCVSAAQVRKLMDLFSFEDNKLDLTKFSYERTVDKNNYFKVNDGFSFDSSVDSLNDYISQKK